MQIDKHTLVFGAVLPDNRKNENGVYIITALMFIKDRHEKFANKMISLAESSGFENSFEFYKTHMIDIYNALLSSESSSMDELIDRDLTPLQKEAVMTLEAVLEEESSPQEARELLRNIIVTYFMSKQPKFRKSDILSAAVFQVASDLGVVLEKDYTQADVAKLFDVSVTSVKKHADAIREYVYEMTMEMAGGSSLANDVGTDPRIT